MVTFCPSKKLYSARPLRKASTRCALSPADRALRNAIKGLLDDCALAPTGQTAEPATTLMNSRRLIAIFRHLVLLLRRGTGHQHNTSRNGPCLPAHSSNSEAWRHANAK